MKRKIGMSAATVLVVVAACDPKVIGNAGNQNDTVATSEGGGPTTTAEPTSGGPDEGMTPTETTTGTAPDPSTSDSGTDTTDTGPASTSDGSESGGVLGECDLWAPDCPDGFKCMPWDDTGGGSWNATRCAPIAPDPRAPGEECGVEGSGFSGLDNCDVGAMCFYVDPETNLGTCVELCSGSAEAPTCAGQCSICSVLEGGLLPLCLAEACNTCPNGACSGTEACTTCPEDCGRCA